MFEQPVAVELRLLPPLIVRTWRGFFPCFDTIQLEEPRSIGWALARYLSWALVVKWHAKLYVPDTARTCRPYCGGVEYGYYVIPVRSPEMESCS